MPDPFVAQLGRISGPMLTEDLLRHGADLAFETDLLYLNVTDGRIGINNDSPNYTLEISTDVSTIFLEATTNAVIDNFVITNNQFTTAMGGIEIRPAVGTPRVLFNKLTTDYLSFNDNVISSTNNRNIEIVSSTTGSVTNTINLLNDTNVTGDLDISGNISLDGDLSPDGNIFIGDSALDLVQIATSIPQNINPGTTLTFDLGIVGRRWGTAYIPDWTNITTISPFTANLNSQMFIGGALNQIIATGTNQDLLLSPETGITVIEQTQWEDGDITNLANTALRFSSTGIGYTRFVGNNAMVLPFGDDSNRPAIPEVGDTRWNTDQDYLECYDGNVYLIATGPGEVVDVATMEELGNVYSLILG